MLAMNLNTPQAVQRLIDRLAPWRKKPAAPPVPPLLWQSVLKNHAFLQHLTAPEQAGLQWLAARFLGSKEFTGANGFEITDEIALTIAVQAVLPLLYLGQPGQAFPSRRWSAKHALDWYDDFVGIVVHPGPVMAQRTRTDAHGVVHHYGEALAGEAMQGGPITLSWQDVARASNDHSIQTGHNLVIHEFAHKLDMQDGHADGCPPLPPHFAGTRGPRSARKHWQTVMQAAYDQLCDQLSLAERFDGEPPWLDRYAATHISEFFAVACEAYFVNRSRLQQDFAPLVALFDDFFKPGYKAYK
jgi:MtfA peptidase